MHIVDFFHYVAGGLMTMTGFLPSDQHWLDPSTLNLSLLL